MEILELGILADVDAGNTNLTDRILLKSGDIVSAGSADSGTTQAEPIALKRAPGVITGCAVFSYYRINRKIYPIITAEHVDLAVNGVRSPRLSAGVVPVVVASEGERSQSRSHGGAMSAAKLPLLGFVEKADRLAVGAETRTFR